MIITNMRILVKSRKRPKPGDVFVFQVEEGRLRFGRVISADARVGPMQNCLLLYIYRASSAEKHRIPNLSKDDLLIPPVMTNSLAWSKGYFETVEHRPLRQEDVLPVHCFWSCANQRYYDDNNSELRRRSEPCGFYGLAGYRAIDDEISKALGIPLAPEDDREPDVLEGGMRITMDAADLAQTGIKGRDQIEDALDKALSACGLGAVTGGGRGVNHANIEVLAADKTKFSEALRVVKSTLRDLHLPRSTRIYLPGEQVHKLYD